MESEVYVIKEHFRKGVQKELAMAMATVADSGMGSQEIAEVLGQLARIRGYFDFDKLNEYSVRNQKLFNIKKCEADAKECCGCGPAGNGLGKLEERVAALEKKAQGRQRTGSEIHIKRDLYKDLWGLGREIDKVDPTKPMVYSSITDYAKAAIRGDIATDVKIIIE